MCCCLKVVTVRATGISANNGRVRALKYTESVAPFLHEARWKRTMTYDGRCSLQRRWKAVSLAVGLGCLAGQAAFPQNAGHNALLTEAGKLLPVMSVAHAWDDAHGGFFFMGKTLPW